MKKLFLYSLLLSLLVSNAKATTYYFSNSGLTTNTGTSTGSPWPASKLTTAFVRGNTVLFHRGETFYIKIPSLATSGTTQIEIGSYGSGSLLYLFLRFTPLFFLLHGFRLVQIFGKRTLLLHLTFPVLPLP
jgi:hypothetical protein